MKDKNAMVTMPERSYAAVRDEGRDRDVSMTGALRERPPGKGRYDLVSPIGLKRLAQHYENGARKYHPRNWEKGMPLSWFYNSAVGHLNDFVAGDRSEDHLAAAAWNMFGYMHVEEKIRLGLLPAELNDMPDALCLPASPPENEDHDVHLDARAVRGARRAGAPRRPKSAKPA